MIIGAAWSTALFGLLAAKNFIGSRLMDLTDAVGLGSETHVVGKPFATVDTGLIPGAGPSPGTGVGVIGLIGAQASSSCFARCVQAFGQAGEFLQDFCDSLGDALVSQMALATLTSQHTPVFSGSGVITPGSIGVVGVDWGASIETEGVGLQFQGQFWGDFADAMGQGMADEVLALGTGNVTISGSFGGSTPPGPLPGAGAGTGNLS